MTKWGRTCWYLLDDVLEYDEKINKSKAARGIFFRSVADDASLPPNYFAETYVPALARLHTYPMDLGTVRKDLIADKFDSHHAFACEVRRVFHNAFGFWVDCQNASKSHPIVVAASTLAKKFEERYKPIVTKEQNEKASKKRTAEEKRRAAEIKKKQKAEDKARREAEKQKRKEIRDREKQIKQRKKEQEKEARKRKKEEDRIRKEKEKKAREAQRALIQGRKRKKRPSNRSGTRRKRPSGPTARERKLEEQLDRMQRMLEGVVSGGGVAPVAAGGGFGTSGGFGGGYGGGGYSGGGSRAGGTQRGGYSEDEEESPPEKKKKKPKKKNTKRPVSDAAKAKCVKGLPKIAQRFVREFKALCKELKLLDKQGTVQLNLHEMPDDDVRKLCEFVKRKLRIIQKEKEQKSDEAASSGLREAAENEAHANKVENERMRNKLDLLDSQVVAAPSKPLPPSAGAAGVVFDSDDEPDAGGMGGDAYDPFAPMSQSSNAARPPSRGFGGPPRAGSWDAAKDLKDADDRRRQAATNANAQLQDANRQEFERDAQDVREQMQKKEGERLKHEEQMRENQAAKDRERDEHRRQQQSAREALAMRDSFENPEADEEYDPYAFGFGDE